MLDVLSPVSKERIQHDVYLQTDGMLSEAVFSRIEDELRAGRRVWVSGPLFEKLSSSVGRKRNGATWIVFSPRRGWEPTWLYRARDVAASFLALIVLFPVLVVLAALVKLSSAGPVFYSTPVVGHGARQFRFFKFRSMRVLLAELDERGREEQFRDFVEQGRRNGGNRQNFKVIDESRVTKIGGILRKYSLDELPQLFNVLKGQMSIVGPRPCLPYEAQMYPRWAQRRFGVTPGLTGIWQVYGRGRVGFEEGLAVDFYYTYARSFWLDLKLILSTIDVVIRGKGAH